MNRADYKPLRGVRDPTRMDGIIRADGWYSILTGAGTARDKTKSFRYLANCLSYEELIELWDGDDMAARIVEIWPDEMLRRGWKITTADNKSVMEDVETHLEEIDLYGHLHQALCKQRGVGGAGILIGANDGSTDMGEPLRPERVVSLDWLSTFDCNELRPSHYYNNPRAPKYGKPSHYVLTPTGAGLEYEDAGENYNDPRPIHESRFLIFDGLKVTNRYRYNNGWGKSVLNRVWDVLSGFNLAWNSVWNIIATSNQGVFKIKGLADMLKRDGGKVLQNRLQAVDLGRSYLRAMAIDADLEDFVQTNASLAGLPESIDRANLRLAAAADMPLIMLMGDSPGGLGSNGSSEERSFYARVATKRPRILTPAIRKIVGLLTKLYKIAPGFKVTYPSLWEPTELEGAQARNVQMLTDKGYVESGVLFSDEVAMARFGGAEFSFETPVDFEAREELEATEADESSPPTPPPSGDVQVDPQSDQPIDEPGDSATNKPPADGTANLTDP